MSKAYGIEIPLYTAFKAECEGKEKTFVCLPRHGCDICAMDNYGLCRRLSCGPTERLDNEAVQFLEINIPSPEIILRFDEGEKPSGSKVEGGEE